MISIIRQADVPVWASAVTLILLALQSVLVAHVGAINH